MLRIIKITLTAIIATGAVILPMTAAQADDLLPPQDLPACGIETPPGQDCIPPMDAPTPPPFDQSDYSDEGPDDKICTWDQTLAANDPACEALTQEIVNWSHSRGLDRLDEDMFELQRRVGILENSLGDSTETATTALWVSGISSAAFIVLLMMYVSLRRKLSSQQ